MSTIDISDLHLPSLILALWYNTSSNYFGLFMPISIDEISSVLSRTKDIDYLAGCPIKTNFSDLRNVNTFLYNRDAGPNAFEKIVTKLRQSS